MYVSRQEPESSEFVARIWTVLLRMQEVSVSSFGQHTRCNEDFNILLSKSRHIMG